MIAVYTIYPGTWSSTGSSYDSTDTISIDFNSTSYCTNYIPAQECQQDDEELLKQEKRAWSRAESLAALLGLKDVHDRAVPHMREGAAPWRCRRPSQRSSATAVRNWRRQ